MCKSPKGEGRAASCAVVPKANEGAGRCGAGRHEVMPKGRFPASAAAGVVPNQDNTSQEPPSHPKRGFNRKVNIKVGGKLWAGDPGHAHRAIR